MTPLSLPVMKRHHFNMLITGGGMIFSNQGQEARDYVKTTLDAMHCFNMKFIPSTYVSDYYAKTPWTVVQDKIKQLTSQIKDHPALLAYLLVDEPELDRIEDFFRGKNEMEKNDSGHSAICCANNVDAANIYAKKIPLYIADYYPVTTVPNRDRGVWAIIDNIQHAKSIGAQNIWLAAQLFGGIGGWRTPTLPEFKIMYFGSLAEGATGFIPYGYAQGTLWLNPEKRQYAESGNLIDPFDTPTEHMVWKKEIAPLFRSTGDFFLQAKRMDDSEIVSSNQETFENAVGRIRRKVGAVMRKTANGKAKLVVAWNNHLDGKISSTLTFPNLKNTDQILDCSTLQILSGQKVEIAFAPGDGNIFMIADANTLKEMCSKISEKRAELEIDLLKSEILDAKNLHLNTTDAETDLKKAESFLSSGKFSDAANTSRKAVEKLNMLRNSTHAIKNIEIIRQMLSKEHAALTEVLQGSQFPIKDLALRQRMTDIKEFGTRFFDLQLSLRNNDTSAAENIKQLLSKMKSKYSVK